MMGTGQAVGTVLGCHIFGVSAKKGELPDP